MSDNRTYISDDEKIISGVCGGLAEHFEKDPTLIRILYIVFTAITGLCIGCLIYYLCTIFMPMRKDETRAGMYPKKRVKNLFLYSLVVLAVYFPLVIGIFYFIALAFGIIALII